MKMYPDRPYITHSDAEIEIFGKLEQTFVDKNWIALHSVRLKNHATKRFGEADFLLCTSFGLYVLEIKGGQVSCQAGRWTYQDRYGNVNTGGSPFHQANTALQGIRQSLTEHFGQVLMGDVCLGFGVILTDTTLPDYALTTGEYDEAMVCHGSQKRDFQRWLSNFIGYWWRKNKQIIPTITPLSNDNIHKIAQFFRPDF